jgi:hypothetical protein
MSLDQVIKRLEQLISSGQAVLRTRSNMQNYADLEPKMLSQWKTSSLSFIDKVQGRESIYYQQFSEIIKHDTAVFCEEGIGILCAFKDDLETGSLTHIEDLVSADIFNDFLEMADYLLEQGYLTPAASLAGAVLEDGMRRLCRKHNIVVRRDDNMNSLHSKLFDKRIYGEEEAKKIKLWTSIRDHADHGKFLDSSTNYKGNDATQMIAGIRNFLLGSIDN